MTKPISLKAWLKKAGPEKAEALAGHAETSTGNMSLIARGHRGGSAAMAVAIVRASWRFTSLPPIAQESVCPALAAFPQLRPTKKRAK